MPIEQAPAFQLYVKEWRSSRAVQRMTFAQRGMYFEMLCEQWENLSLPDSPTECAHLIGGTEQEWVDAWPVLRRKFADRRVSGRPSANIDPDAVGRIVNLRLEKGRKERRSFRNTARKGGLSRALSAKRGKDGTYHPAGDPAGDPAAIQPGVQPDIQPPSSTPSPSSSPSPSPKKEHTDVRTAIPFDVWFLAFQQAYPPQGRTAGPMAMQAFLAAFERDSRPPTEVWAQIEASVKGYAQSESVKSGKVKNMTSWLAGGHYAQVHAAAEPPKASANQSRYQDVAREAGAAMQRGSK